MHTQSQKPDARSHQPPANSEWRMANSEQRIAGLYIHIPFCKQACAYCNFHFSTSLANKELLLQALQKEIQLRSDYLGGTHIASVYFGGGTPTLLTVEEIEELLATISSFHHILPDAEITLEANPDDLSVEKIKALRDTAISRLSIGIQSFSDDELRYMNRAHTASEGMLALERTLAAGFRSLTMDLIYGTPLLTEKRWLASLQRVSAMGVPHLSAYQLTIEHKTALAHQISKGLAAAPDDEKTSYQFEMLMDWAAENGYEHYEISNLAKAGHRAIHNSNYWKGIPYLGIGPSAHSFNGNTREWNIANNARYIKGIETGSARESIEVLSNVELYNEYVMTGLRTIEGVHRDQLLRLGNHFLEHFMESVIPYLEEEMVRFSNGSWTLTRQGKHLADRIASDLFVIP